MRDRWAAAFVGCSAGVVAALVALVLTLTLPTAAARFVWVSCAPLALVGAAWAVRWVQRESASDLSRMEAAERSREALRRACRR